MGKSSQYDTGKTHEFMTAIKNAVHDLGGDDSDLQLVHTEPGLARAVAKVIVSVATITPLKPTDIVEHAPNPKIRLRALEQLCAEDDRPSTQQYAEQKETNLNRFLQNIVEHDVDPQVRLAAAKLVTNKIILAEIALFTEDMKVGYEVTGRITDPHYLARIALKNPTHVPVMEILNRLRGTDMLAEFVLCCENVETALIALEKITSTADLLKISEHARVPAVREKAHRRCAGRV